MSDDILFDATTLNDLELDNRAGLAPMTRVSATADGRATEQMARYYAKFAEGGFSFLVTEGVYTDDTYSQGYLNQPGLVTEDHVEAWTQVTDAVHDFDTPIVAQLMHAGAQVQENPNVESDETIAPSAVQPDGEKSEAYGGSGEYAVPREATLDDLDAVREGFVESATNAVEAGFDGVEIHSANGYLLNEFLAADANQRDDEYGGAPEARVRFPAEVVSAVVEAVPDEFVVGVRVSQTKVTDDSYEWVEGVDAAAVFFEELSAAGADYVHTVDSDAAGPTFGEDGPSLAETAVEYVTDETVVVANGGLGDPDAARAAVDSGADLVTLGTSALANPDWPARVAADADLDQFDPAAFLAPTASISDHETPTDIPTADD
ncbi:NADH:flavin oxidoreductase [Haloferax mediterranei ATCC 33500]|uniref:FMN oxidoreductase protein n=1 Tax=Haloferax mediterranei (strain ATCC 33500 / DSM 1411 / JCM 8866 / NBRC 14739 / NCIMB 2177 / R-4) TaxID=523841 RepID=I3R0I9_HALMT|nr:NADH:flavin oxidoreductase [Haloferax mediterranei]AFK17749.1 FMN oxidoreductase protein [Haloferax mediterranei ATCC 33500]AHZ22819.1 NADH:flavin oxidoreductase [Haloferax mediterranei ATCC 33500]EMA02979.1 FMN oxidoreductase protein [Haloferax mediterranei ATCC 33500]MDX5987838.1 NADH:flavin oxidoreductase [Haloferax mediterranei ATCC 33500]QCQ74314.1 NADH:flavin oxidoreductase [Haloferax mediterranei ATCC 33500]